MRGYHAAGPVGLQREKTMKNWMGLCLMVLALAGCASYQPVPEGYTGPTAVITDSVITEDSSKAQLFVVSEVDGNRIDNSLGASAQASHGQGARLTVRLIDRRLPAKPTKLTLTATHATGAPIHAIASQMAGTFFSVSGVVDFTPQPDGRYVVKGELKKESSSVWIEDAATGQAVTTKIRK
jgi:hypothetical protein